MGGHYGRGPGGGAGDHAAVPPRSPVPAQGGRGPQKWPSKQPRAPHPAPQRAPHPAPRAPRPRRSAATEPEGGNLRESAKAQARRSPRPFGAVFAHRPAATPLRRLGGAHWAEPWRATRGGRGSGRLYKRRAPGLGPPLQTPSPPSLPPPWSTLPCSSTSRSMARPWAACVSRWARARGRGGRARGRGCRLPAGLFHRRRGDKGGPAPPTSPAERPARARDPLPRAPPTASQPRARADPRARPDAAREETGPAPRPAPPRGGNVGNVRESVAALPPRPALGRVGLGAARVRPVLEQRKAACAAGHTGRAAGIAPGGFGALGAGRGAPARAELCTLPRAPPGRRACSPTCCRRRVWRT